MDLVEISNVDLQNAQQIQMTNSEKFTSKDKLVSDGMHFLITVFIIKNNYFLKFKKKLL